MSRTDRSGVNRIPFDAYYTPDALAKACVGTLTRVPAVVVEPSVGGGAFARAVRSRWPLAHIIGCDVNPKATGVSDCDVFHWGDWVNIPVPPADLIIGNPPYSDAEAHIESALSRVKNGGTVAMLLRISFASGKGRIPFWKKYADDLYSVRVLAERPSFTGGATDACDYGWFVWRVGAANTPIFHPGWSWRK